jgi:hypothetical protein
MPDPAKSYQELIEEISFLENRILELEQAFFGKIHEETEPRTKLLTVLHKTSVELT